MITPEQQLASARDAIRSMEEQLVALYAEQEQAVAHEGTIQRLRETVESLDAQVCALLDERSDLERQFATAVRSARPLALTATTAVAA